MKAAAFHEALRRMPLTSPEALTQGQPFIVLSPHPDDESLGMGGVIAATHDAGQRVDVVILTDGSSSHPHSKMFPRDALIALRRAEATRAVTLLGPGPGALTHLGLPDAQAPKEGPDFEESVERLERLAVATGAAAAFVTWGRDPHCDHEAADAMAKALRRRRPELRLWSYPIWGWHLPPDTPIDDPHPKGFRIDIAPWLAKKRAAIAAHASQMTDLIADDPEGFRFDERTIAPFLGPFEYVFEVPA